MPVTYLSKEQQRAAQVRRCLGGAICANGSYKKDLAKNAGMKYHTFLKRLNEPEEERSKMLIQEERKHDG